MVLFSGNDNLYEVELDLPWYYRCSKEFQTQMLDFQLSLGTKLIGVIAMDVEQCAFGYIEGWKLLQLEIMTSGIPSKHSKGGQSAKRFDHLRQEAKRDWFKRIADHARKHFLDDVRVEKIIIHGESFTKRDFIKANVLEYRLQKKVELSDGCYAGEEGLYECRNMLKY